MTYYGSPDSFIKSAGIGVDGYRVGGINHLSSITTTAESDFTVDTPTSVLSYHQVDTTKTSNSIEGSHGYQAQGYVTVGSGNVTADLSAGIDHNSLTGNRPVAAVRLNHLGGDHRESIGFAHTPGVNTVSLEVTKNLNKHWNLIVGASHSNIQGTKDDTRVYVGVRHTFGTVPYYAPTYGAPANARQVVESAVQTDVLGDLRSKTQEKTTVETSSVTTKTGETPKETPDKEKPEIKLKGDAEMTLTVGDAFVDPGFSCVDNVDGDCTSKVTITGTVDTSKVGTYTLTYTAPADKAGNPANTVTRTVTVGEVPDTAKPVITLNGSATVTLTEGDTYVEQGATCTDNKDVVCTVVTTGTVDTATPGVYTTTHTATDTAGNVSTQTRNITVVAYPDPVAGGAFASLGNMTISDEAGGPIVPINAGGVTDPK